MASSKRARRLLALLLTLWLPAAAGQERVFTVGVVPQFEVQRLHEIWRPILDALEERIEGVRFELTGSPTIDAFEREFSQGRFDFAYMNPYHVMLARQRAGYEPLVRDTARRLFGIVVTHAESTVDDVRQLQGQTLAFPAPNALGATLLVKQELLDDYGVEIVPRYVKTHDSVYLNVVLGKVVAGGGVQKTLEMQSKEIQARLKVIHTTRSVAPHPLTVHPRVPEALARAVKEAMLALGETARGRRLLAAVPIVRIGPASAGDYADLARAGLERFYVETGP